MGIIKKFSGSGAGKRLITLNENNCFITLICLKHFSKPQKDRYIFLLMGYFVKIKNENGNVHFNYFLFQIFHADNVMRIFYMTNIITSLTEHRLINILNISDLHGTRK